MVVQESEPSVMCSATQRADMPCAGVVSLTQPFPAKATSGAVDPARCDSSGSSGTHQAVPTSPKTTIATDVAASASSADTYAHMAAASSDSRSDSHSSAAAPPPAAPAEPMLVRSPGRWVPPHMRRRNLEGQALSRTTSMPEFSRPLLVDEGSCLHRVSSSASVKSEKKVRFSARRQVIELPAEDDACFSKCDAAASQTREPAALTDPAADESDLEILV